MTDDRVHTKRVVIIISRGVAVYGLPGEIKDRSHLGANTDNLSTYVEVRTTS